MEAEVECHPALPKPELTLGGSGDGLILRCATTLTENGATRQSLAELMSTRSALTKNCATRIRALKTMHLFAILQASISRAKPE